MAPTDVTHSRPRALDGTTLRDTYEPGLDECGEVRAEPYRQQLPALCVPSHPVSDSLDSSGRWKTLSTQSCVRPQNRGATAAGAW